MENERTATTNKDSSSMQVGVYNQRLTTISSYAPGNILKINFCCFSIFKNVNYSSDTRF